ncbi:MAG: hypothetical protein QY332_16135 [Anaerolineales bacterium]|nr:MAG: hypothetical protein QY332_16135 [Anaerolineales bacterium]
MNTPRLPLTRDLALASRLALLVTILMTLASLGGLLFPMASYPNDDLRQSFLANDVVNLVIGLPILLGMLWLFRRGNLFGLLGLPGALFYVAYNSIAYAAAMPLTLPFFAHLVVRLQSNLT